MKKKDGAFAFRFWLDTSWKFIRLKITLNDLKAAYLEAQEKEKRKEKKNG